MKKSFAQNIENNTEYTSDNPGLVVTQTTKEKFAKFCQSYTNCTISKITGLSKELNIHYPIGTSFCLRHVIERTKNNEATRRNEHQQSDEEYLPDEPLIPEDTLCKDSPISNALEAINSSPLKFQVKRKFVTDLSEGTKIKIKQKYKRAKKLFKQEFAASIAPGQDDSILGLHTM